MAVIQRRDDRTLLVVDEAEIAEAQSFCASLTGIAGSPSPLHLGPPEGDAVPVPPGVRELVRAVIDGVCKGATVTIQPMPQQITTTTAAKMLEVSRPTLMKLIADGQLPARRVGTHTRLLTTDIIAFRAQARADQRRAFDQLRAMDEELGIHP